MCWVTFKEEFREVRGLGRRQSRGRHHFMCQLLFLFTNDLSFFGFFSFKTFLFLWSDPWSDPRSGPLRSDPDFVDVATSAWLGLWCYEYRTNHVSKLNLEIKPPMKQFLRDISALDYNVHFCVNKSLMQQLLPSSHSCHFKRTTELLQFKLLVIRSQSEVYVILQFWIWY